MYIHRNLVNFKISSIGGNITNTLRKETNEKLKFEQKCWETYLKEKKNTRNYKKKYYNVLLQKVNE